MLYYLTCLAMQDPPCTIFLSAKKQSICKTNRNWNYPPAAAVTEPQILHVTQTLKYSATC